MGVKFSQIIDYSNLMPYRNYIFNVGLVDIQSIVLMFQILIID